MEDIDDFNEEDLSNAHQTDTLTSKCPSCGGKMIYNPAIKTLECEYCGRTKSIDFSTYSNEIDLDILFGKRNNDWGEETHVFKCKNCGATQIISKKEISIKCSFCGTDNIVKTDELSGIKPNAVLPFTISKDQAYSSVITWAKRKWLAPKKFKKELNPLDTLGNYYPAFTFDTDTISRYHGVLGKYYYKTERRNGKSVTVRKIRYFRIFGDEIARFDDILVHATNNESQKYLVKIGPYDTNHSQEYKPEFLLGFTASQYSKDGRNCWYEAQNEMKKIIRRQILRHYVYDVVQSLSFNTKYNDCTYKYVLLPIYIGHFRYSNKLYNFYINGQNGKVSGKVPYSTLKISLIVLFIILFILLLVIIYYIRMVD